MRHVTIGNCELYLGDCLEVMEHITSVDAVVTDPPYGLGEPSGTLSKQRAHKRDYEGFDDTYEYLLSCSVPAVIKALSLSNGRGIVTTGAAHAWDYPKPDVLGAFYQPASVGMCRWGRQTSQPILFYGKDPMAGKDIQHTTYLLTEKSSTSEHPCAKPQKAWNWIVKRASLAGEVVLDPFMGSGTTGVSCVKLGRRFIGIEINEKYFELSCKRIQEATNSPDLFIADKIKQEKMI